ncbi:hypothetical protein [Paractinoplanes brasiliensis]|uniref:Uncharacterized protein n=1 Tax=Paractinoplanes brasiliensis TaxID=52695 RepID=A0A4R6J976_9ACTN|nr:hypothetical protein [Actinoplanes brasiliensis]TDO32183.1 hypothetical protein C8E87_7631 [Actinoplanes brasiliensis]GID28236.1 hypothetical protein Abr02nite_32190 [Actinoplanes brasiliensis]
MDSADFALRAYDEGRADGVAGREDHARDSDADYRVGLADGQLAVFEADLIAAIRKAMDGKNGR